MKADAERLVDELRREWPDLRVDLDLFPSGGFMLDVILGERQFQMAFFPSQNKIGVDEVREEDSFTYYYRFTTSEFDAAATELRRIVNAARAETNGIAARTSTDKTVRS